MRLGATRETTMAKKTKTARYVVRYEPIEDGWWLATIPEVPGALTQGRSLRQTRTRIREALSLFVDDAERAELVDDIAFPKVVAVAIGEARKGRVKAEQAREHANVVTRKAISKLLARGVSTRDAAEILGISHQRVAQIKADSARAS